MSSTLHSHTGGTSPQEWRSVFNQLGLLQRFSEFPAHEALLPLLELLQWRGDARELIDLLQLQPTQLRWGDLANVLRALGYQWHERAGSLDRIGVTDVPCLFLDKNGGAILIQEVSADGLLGRTLPDGPVKPVAARRAPGRVATIRLVDEAQAPKAGHWFSNLTRQFRGQFRDVMILGLLINLFALSVPLFTMLVYDRVIAGHNMATLYCLLGGVTIALVAETAFRSLRAISLSWFGVRANHVIAVSMFQRLFSLDPLTIERAPPAAQMVRAKAMESVRDFLTGQSFILFIEFPFMPVLLLVLLLLAPSMALAVFMTSVALAVLLATQLRTIRTLSQHSARALSQRQRDALELFEKLSTLRAYGLSNAIFNRFCLSNAHASAASLDVTWRMQVIEHLVLAFSMAGGLAALLMGVQAAWAGNLTAGGLVGCMIIVWRILMPMQQMAAIAPRLEQVNGGIQQLEHLMALPPERSTPGETATAHAVHGQVDLVNVAMRYPRQSDTVFTGLSLHASPGQMVAIAGANGSGKSSVLKLINGMYKQAGGSIRLDGIDIRQLDPLGLRRGITYIAQTPIIFSGTVLENLMIAAPLASQEQVAVALEMAGAYDEVTQLPQGLNTHLGADGVQLPQELAYKLGLARAYVDLKPLILCDELPYALLSTDAGARFREAMIALKGSHTIFLVAHTSDLVRAADKAIFLRANYRPVIGAPREIIPLMEQPHEHA